MPELDGKHYSYDKKGIAKFKEDKKKKKKKKKKKSLIQRSMDFIHNVDTGSLLGGLGQIPGVSPQEIREHNALVKKNRKAMGAGLAIQAAKRNPDGLISGKPKFLKIGPVVKRFTDKEQEKRNWDQRYNYVRPTRGSRLVHKEDLDPYRSYNYVERKNSGGMVLSGGSGIVSRKKKTKII